MALLLPMDYENALREALERHLIRPDGATPDHLAESIRYSVYSPGKRIRPRLALAAGELLGLSLEATLPVAHALELLHCFTLVHDDLPCMDDADLRRGKASNHKKFGESIALLAGDGLLALAVEVFLECRDSVSPQALTHGLSRLLWAAGPRGVAGGQALEESLTSQSTLEDLQRMHGLKTGALFSAALLIPKDLANIADDSAQGIAIDLFARELGLAFQVADDLEDAAAESTELTNILAYLSKSEAQSMMLGRLAQATRSLEAIFGEQTKPLRLIADEVARKIGGPTPTQIQSTAELENARDKKAPSPTAQASPPRRVARTAKRTP